MLFTYKHGDLSKRFPELRRLQGLASVPLMYAIISRFLSDLQSNPGRYRVDGFNVIYQFNGNNHFNDLYVVVTGATVINIEVGYMNIYITNGKLSQYMPANIIFDAGQEVRFAEELNNRFLEFVKTQKLNELAKEAKIILKTKRVEALRPEIVEFFEME